MKNRVCPHIGRKDDPDTFTEFPSGRNYCHRSSTPVSPLASHQISYCLSRAYPTCPVIAKPAEEPFPFELRTKGSTYFFRKIQFSVLWAKIKAFFRK